MSALWLAVTGHCLVNVVRLFLAVRPTAENANLFYSNLSHITDLVKYGFFVASVCIGDVLLIHRVWVVWGFNGHIIILPILTLIGVAAFGGGLIYQLSQFTSKDNLFTGRFHMWGTGFCVFTRCTNFYTTGFIWYKLWSTSRVVEPLGGSTLVKIMRAFLDSAGLLAAWGLFHFISYQLRSNIQFVAIDGIPAIGGLTNILILIRLRLDLVGHSTQPRGTTVTHMIRFSPDSELGQTQLSFFYPQIFAIGDRKIHRGDAPRDAESMRSTRWDVPTGLIDLGPSRDSPVSRVPLRAYDKSIICTAYHVQGSRANIGPVEIEDDERDAAERWEPYALSVPCPQSAEIALWGDNSRRASCGHLPIER
ncbi:hypothetical protein DFH09DRAFT_1360426 [Mycena vulgaris]|nr:hypothetical protein DFH09DRAFT_1360426 [Mycena vulgaris]